MSNGVPAQPELEALAHGYIEGGLSPAEAERLLAGLKQDETLARSLLESLETDALLRELVSTNDWLAIEPPSAPRTHKRLVDARHLFGKWLALAAMLAFAAISLTWFFAPVRQPVLSGSFTRPVSVKRHGVALNAAPGFLLQPNDVIQSGAEHVLIDFAPEHTRLDLEPASELKLLASRRGKRLEIIRGDLFASVAAQPFARPMILRTPQAEARVVGTEFLLHSTVTDTKLEVLEGKVRLTRQSDKKSAEVEGGYYANATSTSFLSPQRTTGKVLREFWLKLPGDTLQSLIFSPRFPNSPDGRDYPSSFETSTNWPSPFGTRLRGYLIPPTTGDYIFSVQGNGQMRLFLSPDEDAANKAIVAQIIFTANRLPGDVAGTASRNVSEPITLDAGQRYYIELLHKFGSGPDNISVFWTKPDGATEPIPSGQLAPAAQRAKP
jgi:hypothetical protein